MADFTKTITESMSIFGISEPNLWGTFLWNELWGASGDLRKDYVRAPIGNSVSIADAVGKDFVRDAIKHANNR